jgi:hypothetical protein
MAQRNIKSALVSSLSSEKKAIESRFEKAESFLGSKPSIAEKESVIRDSFTMPTADYALLELIKARCLQVGKGVNKSEIVRAGLQALSKLSTDELVSAFDGVVKVPVGRRMRS